MDGPTCHARLRRFWFPLSSGLGIGVTSGSEAEARELAESVRTRYYPEQSFVGFVPDVDISTLDAKHVLPNMGPVVVRGRLVPAAKPLKAAGSTGLCCVSSIAPDVDHPAERRPESRSRHRRFG